MIELLLLCLILLAVLSLALFLSILLLLIKYLNLDLLQIGMLGTEGLDTYILGKLQEKIHLMYFKGIRLAQKIAELGFIDEEDRDSLIIDFKTWKGENRLVVGREQADMNVKLPDLSEFSDIANREWQDFLKEARTLSRVATWIVRFSD